MCINDGGLTKIHSLYVCICMHIQYMHAYKYISNGTSLLQMLLDLNFSLFTEVYSIHKSFITQYYTETQNGVLIIEVPSIHGCV